jgi:8-oxo-dGTP diphosphatase
VLEETGLRLENARYCGIVTFVSDIWETEYMHLFYSDSFSGEIKECDEGELCWVDKEEIYSLPIWEGDKIFLKLIEENVPFFSLKLEYKGDTLINAILNGEKI